MPNPYGYNFYIKDGSDVLTFPITPGELTIKVGSNNKVINLIDEGDINVLKSPSLVEVEFEARFPMRKYPYSRTVSDFQTYFDKFQELKEEKRSFRFIVTRTTPNGNRTWDTNLLMALEEFEITESADEGDDVLVSFKLKQYKEYGVKTVKVANSTPTTTSTSETPRASDKAQSTGTYTVKDGDTLFTIAKKHYGDGAKWAVIYDANERVIEYTAAKDGRYSSSYGRYLYGGTNLVIPPLKVATSYEQQNKSDSTKKAKGFQFGHNAGFLNQEVFD